MVLNIVLRKLLNFVLTKSDKQVMKNAQKIEKSRLIPAEMRPAFKVYVKSFLTKEACRQDLGVNIRTLNGLIEKNRASPATIEKVLNKIAA